MAAIPPVILVLDVSALSAASPTEWREFSRIGNCYLPQVVYEEMKMLFDRSPDPDLERLSKLFNRFYATSGWQVSDAIAHPPQLRGSTGQAMTRRARISLAVGRCACGLAQEFPHSLVVLVSKDRALLQRIYKISIVNLCGVTGEAALQWSRTGQRPVPVSQKFQQFRAAHGIRPAQSTPVSPASPASIASSNATPSSPSSVSPAPSTVKSAWFSPVRNALSWKWLSEVKLLILAAMGLAIAGYLLYRLVQIVDFKELSQPLPTSQSFIHSIDRHLNSKLLHNLELL